MGAHGDFCKDKEDLQGEEEKSFLHEKEWENLVEESSHLHRTDEKNTRLDHLFVTVFVNRH